MAIKHVVTRGFAFDDGTKYISTRGYGNYEIIVGGNLLSLGYTLPLRNFDLATKSRLHDYAPDNNRPDFTPPKRLLDHTAQPRNPDYTPVRR